MVHFSLAKNRWVTSLLPAALVFIYFYLSFFANNTCTGVIQPNTCSPYTGVDFAVEYSRFFLIPGIIVYLLASASRKRVVISSLAVGGLLVVSLFAVFGLFFPGPITFILIGTLVVVYGSLLGLIIHNSFGHNGHAGHAGHPLHVTSTHHLHPSNV